METRRFGAALALAASALAASAMAAQEAPAPAPEAASGPAVTLAYRFRPGQLQRFRGNVAMDMTITPEGGGAGLGPIPLTGKIDMVYTEKVAGEREGVGTIALKLDRMAMSYNVLGNTIAIRQQNGKWVTTVNGQPAPAGAAPNALSGLASAPTGPILFRRTRRGGTLDASSSGELQKVFGSALFAAELLPEGPVRVGDSWETTQKMALNAPAVGLPGGTALPEVEVRLRHTLAALENRNGRQFALIESTGSTETPAGSSMQVTQSFSGRSRFDVGRGVLTSAQFTIDMAMKLPLPAAAAPEGAGNPPAGAPAAMSLDGQMIVTLREEATSAPAARPAAGRATPGRAPARSARPPVRRR